MFRPPGKCPKKLFDEGFDNPAMQGKGVDMKYKFYDTPKIWLGYSEDPANDFSPDTSTSFFRIINGRLVARDIGDESRPQNSALLKTQQIDVEDLEKITVFLDVWKIGGLFTRRQTNKEKKQNKNPLLFCSVHFIGLNGDVLDDHDFIKIFVLEDGKRLKSIGEYKGTVSWVEQKLCIMFNLRPQTQNIVIKIKVFNTTPNEIWKLDNLQICGTPKPPCVKLYQCDFDKSNIQGKGLFPTNGEIYLDPNGKFTLLREGDNDFENDSYFQISNGKLVAHNIGTGAKPQNGVWFKTKKIDVRFVRRIEIEFFLWKKGAFLLFFI